MCIDMGMTTCSGTGILLVGCPAVAFTCGTAAPLAERFRDLNNLISPVSLIFLAADGISAPPSVVDNYTDLLYHFSKACQATKYDKRSVLHRTRKICNNLGNRRRIKSCIKINNPTKKTPGRCRSAGVIPQGSDMPGPCFYLQLDLLQPQQRQNVDLDSLQQLVDGAASLAPCIGPPNSGSTMSSCSGPKLTA
mgnify:CR=1 FL=1